MKLSHIALYATRAETKRIDDDRSDRFFRIFSAADFGGFVPAVGHGTNPCSAGPSFCFTLAIADGFAEAGVSEIVALRGDPPKGTGAFKVHPGGFANSVELIEALSARNKFTIRVGAYPDKHPEAADQQADIDWLKAKLDAGADEALTQFFFEAETFLRFRDACVKAGIDKPIVPGILPIENWKGASKFARACGTVIPEWVEAAFETAIRDGREDLLATALCTELCSDLLEEGVDSLHFYTLNHPELTRDVCHAIGVTPKVVLENVA